MASTCPYSGIIWQVLNLCEVVTEYEVRGKVPALQLRRYTHSVRCQVRMRSSQLIWEGTGYWL